ncbi:DUF805 domain-containing protein [Stagnihabitans tardus]|uniref:DUF805 domain-containing protein n=1 Tax=Stagnihabitans tardus TaxID=2699202 RepID=A0AAE4YA26_9RHOB|nr:DUF805 domain-containing protein [Stagnihabitans tardus]NBZ87641.1 DUF805 domain-containing protein [Stagnihabitans tardus]
MGPAEAIRTGFAKSFQYSGRASRSEYWWFLPVGAALPVAALGTALTLRPDMPFPLLFGLGALALSPLMAVTRRRLLDSGEAPIWFETPLMALVIFCAALWAEVSLNRWAFDLWAQGADGPGGFGVMICWLMGNILLLPILFHQFFVGLITGSALFSQMAAPSRQAPPRSGPSPTEAPK